MKPITLLQGADCWYGGAHGPLRRHHHRGRHCRRFRRLRDRGHTLRAHPRGREPSRLPHQRPLRRRVHRDLRQRHHPGADHRKPRLLRGPSRGVQRQPAAQPAWRGLRRAGGPDGTAGGDDRPCEGPCPRHDHAGQGRPAGAGPHSEAGLRRGRRDRALGHGHRHRIAARRLPARRQGTRRPAESATQAWLRWNRRATAGRCAPAAARSPPGSWSTPPAPGRMWWPGWPGQPHAVWCPSGAPR